MYLHMYVCKYVCTSYIHDNNIVYIASNVAIAAIYAIDAIWEFLITGFSFLHPHNCKVFKLFIATNL